MLIGCPSQVELDFLELVNDIDFDDVFKNINDPDYLRTSGLMDKIDYSLSLVENPKKLYSWEYQINQCWLLYNDIKLKHDTEYKDYYKINLDFD